MSESVIKFPDRNSEICKKLKEDFEKRKIVNNYDMDRVARENLINLGGLEDDRSEFDKRLDKKESDELTKEFDEIIDFIESHNID